MKGKHKIMVAGPYITVDMDATVDTLLVPVMFGGSYNQNINEKFSLNGKLFFGYGLVKSKAAVKMVANVKNRYVETSTNEALDGTGESKGDNGCFVGDMSIGATIFVYKEIWIGT